MITIFVHRDGRTEQAAKFDRSWLNPASGVEVWVDLAAPSIPEQLLLTDTFVFHRLSVEDVLSKKPYPKAEAYDGYLYVILHGPEDVHFFVGPNYLVTVHGGSAPIVELRDHATRNPRILSEGPVALLHRCADGLVDSHRPVMDKVEERIDDLAKRIFDRPDPALVRRLLDEKRQLAGLRRVITPQRDVVARMARREFVDISTEMSFRFRDVHDHLVRIDGDAALAQERIADLLAVLAMPLMSQRRGIW
jgi:magnesium transporter